MLNKFSLTNWLMSFSYLGGFWRLAHLPFKMRYRFCCNWACDFEIWVAIIESKAGQKGV